MADEPLVSAEEVASVLSGGEDERPDPAASADGAEGSGGYSLRRPVAIAPDEEPLARQRVEDFAGFLVDALSRELDTQIEAELTGFQQQQTSVAVESMPEPAWILEFQCPSGGGIGLVLEPASALTLVELALGGVGSLPSAGREPTPLESRVLHNLLIAVSETLGDKVGTTFANGAFVVGKISGRLAAPGEMVGAGLLNLKFGDASGRGLLLVTAGLLRTAEARPTEQARLSVGPLASRLEKVTVEARPVLEVGRVSLQDLMDLKEGTVLQLNVLESKLIELRLAGRALFAGRVARCDGHGEFTVFWRSGRKANAATEPAPAIEKETA